MPQRKIDELANLITREIKKIKKEAGEINLMVSGGVDSGVLAALSNPDRVFTVRLPYGTRHDELGDAASIIRYLDLDDKWDVIDLDEDRFDEVMEKAVKAIGRPIPHFNIFPLYIAFEYMAKMGVKDVVVGDGPDETMCGYTRHLIMAYLYGSYDIESFKHYEPTIAKLLPPPSVAYAKLIGKDHSEIKSYYHDDLLDFMCRVDMDIMRPDMMDMSHGLAKHFGIKIHAPYESKVIDNYMMSLPDEEKIDTDEWYGKYLLRDLAGELIPSDIAWRKHKIGGPVVPVNEIKGWKDVGPFSKERYLEWQREILNSVQ